MKILLSILSIIFTSSAGFSQIFIESNMEGGNAQLLAANYSANTIKIQSAFRPGDVHNVHFFFKAGGYNQQQQLKIQVRFNEQYYVPALAAYSYDQINWTRIAGSIISNYKEFVINNPAQPEIYFSVGYPYTYSSMLEMISRHQSNAFLNVSDIALSEQGRGVKLLTITDKCVPDSGKYVMWMLGRQHAMELHSNYVVEGFIDRLLSNNPDMVNLRKKAIIYVVPIMDVDNAFLGGTGKDRTPIDFNRDWDSPSYWNAVNAVKQKMIQTNDRGKFKLFIDSHNPFPSGQEKLFFYGLHTTGVKSANLNLFRDICVVNSGYPFDRLELYPTAGQTASRWVDSIFSSIELSTTIETGWVNRTDNVQWNIHLYKNNGRVLADAVLDYFSNIVKPEDIFIDNNDTANVDITGSWVSSTSLPGYHGINYLHDNNSGKGSKSVKYNFPVQQQGFYEVYLKWVSSSDRADNVPVKIMYAGGIKDTIVNMKKQGSRWVSLGIYQIGHGSSLLIENRNTNEFVIADAVRLSKANDCESVGINNYSTSSDFSVKVYPNPFNPSGNFEFNLPQSAEVELIVYDLSGKKVFNISSHFSPGLNKLIFNESLSSGIYYYQFNAAYSTGKKQTALGKFVIIK